MTDQPIRDAATMILLRRGSEGPSVLMGMRGAKAAFMPSKYVFPGGAVDPDDGAAPLAAMPSPENVARIMSEPRDGVTVSPGAIAAAGLRELVEETGLMIGKPGDSRNPWPGYGDSGLLPDASQMHYIFRAITPPGRPRRFDAYFFLADADQITGDRDDFSRACDELSHLHWVPLAKARALDLPFITEVVLAEVAQLVATVGPHDPLPLPRTVPFFDNRGPVPRFSQIA
ncbi:NUDIX hydrolase [Paracoccus homiensis]|uniref:Nudix hydrolase domain-containing protein n=1 Tax=Paracoccus homiensis TaxID=364199 RepID=A0A1I0CKE8_9RHOB|nr:DNA mismatch repair protein MutT [Paracoccus homiensis]SET19461.1 hypothetical protein SAMN04489858_103336 [Paracoccus homiensis]